MASLNCYVDCEIKRDGVFKLIKYTQRDGPMDEILFNDRVLLEIQLRLFRAS